MTAQQLVERERRAGARSGHGSGWAIAAGLLLLSAVPLTAGALRLVQLGGGPDIFPADDRFDSVPVALLVHIVGSAIYAVFGSLQFVTRFRRRHRAWHRRVGRVLILAGLLVAGSGMWMTLTYAAQPGTGDLLYLFRLVVVSATVMCLVLGFAAVRRRDIAAHRAWMIRAYALALGAGTQVFTQGLGGAVFGTGEVAGDLAKGAGWVVNLAVAEWAIRRSATPARTSGARS
ncbi:MAG: DUF2306 domain-containing protein [Nocardioides sp.]